MANDAYWTGMGKALYWWFAQIQIRLNNCWPDLWDNLDPADQAAWIELARSTDFEFSDDQLAAGIQEQM